jgi:diguanylate cyclase (GGDEF)-like protein
MDTPLALIIGDDQESAKLFSHILEFVGYETEVIRAGEAALSRLDEVVPKIVLLDLNISSGISAIDILGRIRGQKRLDGVPVLVITAFPNNVEGLQEEADLVLVKPVIPKQLGSLVSRFYPHEISAKLMENATLDAVTGLPNRVLFLKRLEHAVGLVKRHQDYKFAVLVITLGKIESLTNIHGRKIEEDLSIEIAHRLKPLLRNIDTIARTGRNEFAILLEDIRQYDDALIVSKKLKNELILPFSFKGENLEIPVTFKSTISKDKYERPEDFLNNVASFEVPS